MYNNNFNNRYGGHMQMNQGYRETNSSNLKKSDSNPTNNYYNTENNIHTKDSQNFDSNPRLKNINPTKLKIINEIRRQSKTKSMEELLPEIMRINKELNQRNMNFTKEETALLMEAIEETLSPAEKKKFQMLKSFL